MVFSSVPAYLDPASWNQEPSHQSVAGGLGGVVDAHQLPPAVAPRSDGNAGVPARPGSMAERARLAKVPQPEPGLKCPRCESTNTKFCYFNNYSLSQPRHFCKTCRRYWTRGGALRNVPVGGGCRRNKRSKSGGGGSKSSVAAADRQAAGISASSATSVAAAASLPSNIPPPSQLPPFLSSLHPLAADYGGVAANIRLNLGSMQPIDTMDLHVGSCSSIGLEHWRLQQVQQFPFLAGLEPAASPLPSMGLFPFDGDHGSVDGVFGGLAGHVHGKPSTSTSGLITQLASVKMEENTQELVLPKQYLGIPGGDQYWVGGGSGRSTAASSGWTDLSGFNSSSTSNIL